MEGQRKWNASGKDFFRFLFGDSGLRPRLAAISSSRHIRRGAFAIAFYRRGGDERHRRTGPVIPYPAVVEQQPQNKQRYGKKLFHP